MVRWEVDTSVYYLKNLITDFGINCGSKFEIGLIGSMYFLGEAMASLVYIVFAKHLQSSRIRHIWVKNFTMMIVLIVLVKVARSLPLLYLCVFIIGICQSVSIIQGYTHLMESMPFGCRNLVSSITQIVEKSVLVITTLLLKYHESNWWI